jgi:K+-transporting ATPase KdpF subunit
VSAEQLVALLLSAAVAAYLVHALLHPERY